MSDTSEPVSPENDKVFRLSRQTEKTFPRVIGDVGGTNARFAIEISPGVFSALASYANRDFASFEAALRFYLSRPESVSAGSSTLRYAAIAIANPIDGDQIKMTNSEWAFSLSRVQEAFGFQVFLLVNDFTALAMALPFLPRQYIRQWGGKERLENRVIGLIGAGTGLGVSGLVPSSHGWIPLETEGGHVSFSPFDELEVKIWQRARKQLGHVSAERLLSGRGLELLYRLVAEIEDRAVDPLMAHQITEGALRKTCDLCDLTVEIFCRMLGTVSGNLALTLGAKGGLYIGGGIVPRLKERFFESGFRKRFEEKGRFSAYLASIPVFVVTDSYAAFGGVSLLLDNYLKR